MSLGVLATIYGVHTLHSGRFQSADYAGAAGPAAAFRGMIAMAFGVALCASALFGIDVFNILTRWIAEVRR